MNDLALQEHINYLVNTRWAFHALITDMKSIIQGSSLRVIR
uniref:Uncharacterized protein n=1 Tax=Candidatus Kentrum eta TaxID=2126337 RepID=A0A450UHW8_9GAMM|nr:MAG: hypothetical protein BECKH772A_GA0070896_1003911 [Candidatus Kentron sp. H]VFJ93022.1 MAG: hypothetical protein BECKH772B_GA0070898_1003711 [Candidatus Kentron sp. H]VFJ99876.1 MAG: hypothetical protein BECKH772C_GA0070978_1003611 [Candidatus Kentron sp. H]